MFLFGVRKIICIEPFLDVQEVYSWSTGEMGGEGVGDGGRLNKFLKVDCCLDLVTFFQHLNVSIYRIKTLKFSRQLRLQG